MYIVATPIGNLGDITLRALETLAASDIVACEDTRITGRLMRHFGLRTPLTAYHDHNAARKRPELLAAVAEGKVVSLVSDAGTPLVSDPGYRLVREAIDADLPVVALPGASALLTGLAVAGLPTDSFLFAGFPPPKPTGRRKRLEELASAPATLVFYESAGRLSAALADMAAVLGERPAAVARELTKRFEEVRRGSLADLAAHYEEAGPPKGEIVVLVAPPGEKAIRPDDVDALLRDLLRSESVSRSAQLAAAETGLPRRDLYRRALALSGEAE